MFAVMLLISSMTTGAAFADDLTKMIQQDLVTLGYEPGNTDGEATTQTIVAISTFQAEHGLEVTGEASPQLAGVIKAAITEQNEPASSASVAAAAAAPNPAALHAAQQACLQQKIAAKQEANKKKRGFGSLMRAVSRTASRIGGNAAYDIARTTHDIYDVNATAADLQSAAEDLGLAESELEECRNPPMSTGVASTESGKPGMPPVMDMGAMGMGMETIPAPPDNNVQLPDSYSFSYRASLRIKNSKGTAEPVFYLQPDASYFAREQANNGLTEFLVLDNQNNVAVIFAEYEDKKRRLHNQINLETKAALLGAYRDAPEKEPTKAIEGKTILGYYSQGYEISTEAGTTRLWITDEAPASLFSSMFAHRADEPGSPFSKGSMIMEATFTSANAPEKNYQMVLTGLQLESLVLNKSDYQEAP
jgi:peptidoglycan hydrolase-like protein with peptidoglycan-binding domain